ncbi:MAG: methionyl-tRNA formyltransferase [Syntrophobacteraceae bacterium]
METEAEGRERGLIEWPAVVFFGTPAFAVPTLEKLAGAGVLITLVVTQPDRPSGRGKKLTSPPVKTVAQQLGYPVYQPERLKTETVRTSMAEYGGECAVVVAYGQIIPQSLLEHYPLGALNIHGSLLPRLRGAAPMQRAILAGERTTGISIMLLDAGMDTGPVLGQRALQLGESETFGSLHDRMAHEGADFLLEILAGWKAGRLAPQPQSEADATYAPPISKDELRIEWSLPAARIVNIIRAFDPMPGAFGYLGGRRIKYFGASLSPLRQDGRAGEVLGAGEQGLVVLAGDGVALSIGEVQLEGQRRVSANAFLRGHPINRDTRFE